MSLRVRVRQPQSGTVAEINKNRLSDADSIRTKEIADLDARLEVAVGAIREMNNTTNDDEFPDSVADKIVSEHEAAIRACLSLPYYDDSTRELKAKAVCSWDIGGTTPEYVDEEFVLEAMRLLAQKYWPGHQLHY